MSIFENFEKKLQAEPKSIVLQRVPTPVFCPLQAVCWQARP